RNLSRKRRPRWSGGRLRCVAASRRQWISSSSHACSAAAGGSWPAGDVMKIIVEFCGGTLDGKRCVGDESSGEAAAYYWLTDHGRVGQRFHTFDDYAHDACTQLD